METCLAQALPAQWCGASLNTTRTGHRTDHLVRERSCEKKLVMVAYLPNPKGLILGPSANRLQGQRSLIIMLQVLQVIR